MVKLMISTAFLGKALIRVKPLLERNNFSDPSVNGAASIKGQLIFKAHSFIDEI